MTKLARKVLIIVFVVLLVLIGIGWFFFNQMNKPLYIPGNLAASNIEVPVQKGDSAFWDMEEDIRIYHFSKGVGTNILSLHGGPGMPWATTLEGFTKLSDQYKFHYYDQRGSGRSTRPFDRFETEKFYPNLIKLEGKLGLNAQLKDIERIRQLLGDDKIILVGHSFGGFIGSLYAAEFPEKVKALILVAPANLFKFPAENADLFQKIVADLSEEMQEEFHAWQKEYFDYKNIWKKSEKEMQDINGRFAEFYKLALEARGYEMPDMEYQPDLIAGWAMHAIYFSMGKKHDYRDAVSKVDVPVLVIHGADDIFQSKKASQDVADLFQNGQMEIIENSGHFPFVEQPEEFAGIVKRFLGSLD
ncbi:MAG: alpha/beta fold hydrolase [Bacteroidetes bacterium]|nr:alpha/beta fold hydrolase [Bacteroidota bacterium]